MRMVLCGTNPTTIIVECLTFFLYTMHKDIAIVAVLDMLSGNVH